MVALRSDIEVLYEREEAKEAAEKRRKRNQLKAEKESLFNMTDEEYQRLSDSE